MGLSASPTHLLLEDTCQLGNPTNMGSPYGPIRSPDGPLGSPNGPVGSPDKPVGPTE